MRATRRPLVGRKGRSCAVCRTRRGRLSRQCRSFAGGTRPAVVSACLYRGRRRSRSCRPWRGRGRPCSQSSSMYRRASAAPNGSPLLPPSSLLPTRAAVMATAATTATYAYSSVVLIEDFVSVVQRRTYDRLLLEDLRRLDIVNFGSCVVGCRSARTRECGRTVLQVPTAPPMTPRGVLVGDGLPLPPGWVRRRVHQHGLGMQRVGPFVVARPGSQRAALTRAPMRSGFTQRSNRSAVVVLR